MERELSVQDSTVTSSPKPDEIEKDLIRQGERTIDNLKRLFAFVFAFSFGVVATGAYQKIENILVSPTDENISVWDFLLAAEMMAVFVVTAGVFYHQGAKSLDIRYAKHPLAKASPGGLAVDYFVQFGTMLPFYFMAYSLGAGVALKVGYIWFFVSYVVLLSWGLMLLVISDVRHSIFIRRRLNESLDPQETVREGLLRTYWLLMNSIILLLIVGMFWVFVRAGFKCPASSSLGQPRTFLYLFGVFAFLRDILDYFYAWRFIYPIHEDRALSLDRWPMTSMRDSKRLRLWTIPAYVAMTATVFILLDLKFWDFSFWANACTQ